MLNAMFVTYNKKALNGKNACIARTHFMEFNLKGSISRDFAIKTVAITIEHVYICILLIWPQFYIKDCLRFFGFGWFGSRLMHTISTIQKQQLLRCDHLVKNSC